MVRSAPPRPDTRARPARRPGRPKTKPKADKAQAAPAATSAADGLQARDAAVSSLYSVFVEKRAFDDAFQSAVETRHLSPRDRAFARLVATTVLRNRGALNSVIASFLEKPLPENRGRLEPILLAAVAQLLILKTPPHAAISLAVDQCRADRAAGRFDKLANAVLRRTSEKGAALLAERDSVVLSFPSWLLARWTAVYGEAQARALAAASLTEAPLDLTVRADPEAWASRLGGIALPTGSVRLKHAGRIEEIEGYGAGAWWVQDAAAALPARLLGNVTGLRVADICAAPGGKTAQLAAAGGIVTAIDKSPGRLKRLAANLSRLGLTASTVVADAATYAAEEPFDAVLVDAPCTATGTIRRHPDIMYLKRPEDVAALAALQVRILEASSRNLKPGGTLVYCTCSLEADECEQQIEAFMQRNPGFVRRPIAPAEIGAQQSWISPQGDLRTLPIHLGDLPDGLKGLDGFYAARLVRNG